MRRINKKITENPFQKNIKWVDTFTDIDTDATEETQPSSGNLNMFIGILIVVPVFLYLFWGLVNLQIVQGVEFKDRSTSNHLVYEPIDPDRGIIYDVNGVKLLENINGYKLVVEVKDDPEVLVSEFDTLSDLSGEKLDDLTARYIEAYESDYGTELTLIANCSRDLVLRFKTVENEFKYVKIVETKYRNYLTEESTAHVLGYTGEVSEYDLKRNELLDSGDIVGKEGVEYTYDALLRGEKGEKIMEVDALNNPVSDEYRQVVEPTAGASVYLSLDIIIQEKAYELLEKYVPEFGGSAGVVVIQDVDTGKLLALTNYPSYNNNIFVGGISAEESLEYESLILNERAPLLNRAIAGAQPPGSTFKILVASILLDTGAVTPNTVINSTGITYIGEDNLPIQEYAARAHGPLTVVSGICKSSNIFFCRGFIDSDLSIAEFDEYATAFGVGEKTGIDLPGETAGVLPSPENKALQASYASWLDPYWYLGDSCVTAFGQGITLITPIQLLSITSYIANGGILWEPTVVDKIVYSNGQEEVNNAEIRARNIVDPWVLEYVRAGMDCTANTGGGVIVPFFNSEVRVAAKTGTAEFGELNDKGYYEHTHAWVTGYFPAENPQYSFVVFIEDGGQSNNSAIVMRELVDFMLDLGYIDL